MVAKNMGMSIWNAASIITLVILLLFAVEPSSAGEIAEEKVSNPSVVSGNDGRQSKTGHGSGGSFGGPDAVENLIRSDRQQIDALFELEFLDPWFAFKEEIIEDTGLSFSIDYSSIGFGATDSPGDDGAVSGMFRVFGVWELIGRGTRDTGALVFKVEDRHSFTDVAPSGFGFDIGYVGLLNAPFSDEGFRLTNLYWR
jgi:porin